MNKSICVKSNKLLNKPNKQRNICKKSQASLEFLVTYGWAILIILVAIGALVFFGIGNPANSLPEKCIFGNGIICQDVRIATNAINMTLINGVGKTIYNVDVAENGFTCGLGGVPPPPISSVSPGSIIRYNCANPTGVTLTNGQKTKLKFKVTFQKVNGGYDQVSLGEVYSTVQ